MGFGLQAFGCTFRLVPWHLDPAPLPLSPGPWPLDPMPLVAGPGHLSLALASGPWYRDPGLDPCPWLAPVVPCSWSCCSWPLGWAMGLSALLMGLGPWPRAWVVVSTTFSNPHKLSLLIWGSGVPIQKLMCGPIHKSWAVTHREKSPCLKGST